MLRFHIKNLLLFEICALGILITAWKLSKYGVISGPNFPAFELNTEIYGVNLRTLSKYRKIRTRKNSVFGHFLRSEKLNLKRTIKKSIFSKQNSEWQIKSLNHSQNNSCFSAAFDHSDLYENYPEIYRI